MPSPSATLSTLQVGTYTPATDSWTQVLDLNDRTNFYIRTGGMKLNQPEKAYVTSFTIRARGERVLRNQYKNRHILASIWIRGATTTAIVTNVRNLLSAIEQPPYRLKVALPGSAGFSYADCVKVTHNIPSDGQEILGGAINHVEIDFECAPGLSADQASGGTRLSLENLLVNPGFEAPGISSGGAFADTFATTNAYAVQAGGTLVQDKNTYVDAVLADSPLRYYRLDEASGSTAFDAMGTGNNGTYQASPTLGTTGLLTGDSDTAITINGTSQYVSAASTGLPSGSGGGGTWSVEAWIKPTNASAFAAMMKWGGNSGSTGIDFAMNSSNQPYIGFAAGTAATGSALTSGTIYHLVGTYDGTNLRLYQNGSLVAGPTAATGTIGTGALALGAQSGGGGEFFKGVLDECAVYTTALNATRISAHYTAGTTTPANTANTMQIPTGGRIAFGSPDWSAIWRWQVRFRWLTSLTATFYLHYTDANNYLAATVTGTQLTLKHVVASVTNTLGTASFTLTNGMEYWLQATQFPNIDTAPMPQGALFLYADGGGFPGALVGSMGSIALSSLSVATAGRPQIAASGAALGMSGNTVTLFGPGGWRLINQGAATGLSSGAWQQNTTNTYSGGPVASVGAAEITFAPAGVVDAYWASCDETAPAAAGTTAISVSGSQTVTVAGWIKSSGLNANASQAIAIAEWDGSGTFLGVTIGPQLSGNQSSYTQVTQTLTVSSSTRYISLRCIALDLSVAGESANGTIYFDNIQVWNQTTTGQATMPYCELRFPAAPAQLMVSGLVGDIAAPCYLALGAFLSSLATGGSVTFGIGRRATPSASAVLIGNLQVYTGIATAVLDSTAYGGYYLKSASNATAIEYDPPTAPRPTVNQIAGTWHFFARAQSNQATIANVTVKANQADSGWVAYGSQIAPLATASTWTMVDAGQVAFPIGQSAAIAQNPAVANVSASTQWADSTGGGSTIEANWYAYVPVDTNLLYGTILNPSNAGGAITNTWFYIYNDALGPFSQVGVGWRLSQETKALPAPSTAIGGPGTLTSIYPSVNPSADLFLYLDPTTNANTAGVNQLVAILADNNGAVLPLAVDLVYVPQYLYPK